MSDYMIGIDPGITGAIALLKDGDLLKVWDMPVKNDGSKNIFCSFMFNDFIHDLMLSDNGILYEDLNVFMEEPLTMALKGNAPAKQNLLGGQIIGVLAANSIECNLVHPNKWKKHYPTKKHSLADLMLDNTDSSKQKLTRINKDQYRLKAIELFPEFESSFELKKHCDRAEAALIGLYGYSLIR